MAYLKKFNGYLFEDISHITGQSISSLKNLNEINLRDGDLPVVSSFVIPSSASALTFSIISFIAEDYVGVTGYKITETSTPPNPGDAGWTGSAPTTYTAAGFGTKTLYAWAKDGNNNVSSGLVSRTIVLSDTGIPTVTSFIIPSTVIFPSTSELYTVPISSFTASDNVGVTGYKVTENSPAPGPGAADWSASPQTNHTFSSPGSKNLYGWAKDSNGNVSVLTGQSWKNVVISIYVPPPAPVLRSVTLYPIGNYSIQCWVWPSELGSANWQGARNDFPGGMVGSEGGALQDTYFMTNPGLNNISIQNVTAYAYSRCYYTHSYVKVHVAYNWSIAYSLHASNGAFSVNYGALAININNLLAGVMCNFGGAEPNSYTAINNFRVVVQYYQN